MDDVDVLIVGGGASAAAFAWSLADTRMKIVCMEQGDWIDHTQYPATSSNWEMRNDFSSDPNIRRAPADYPINNEQSDIAVANFNGVGGGTILYAAHFPRLHPSDFKVKTLDGVADDWPIDYETLAPFYEVNDRMMGVAGLAGDPAYPPKQPPMPPLPLGRSGTALARGYNALNWHWWPADVAINTEAYGGRDKCINMGLCGIGCAQGAKASVDITYWPEAQRQGIHLLTNCRVREITLGRNGMATGVTYFDKEGKEQHQSAQMVVLACNGIGTPRLLLNSKSNLFPDGLANSSGLVGKNLMFHPYTVVEALFEEQLDGSRGPHKGIQSHEFYETDESRGFVRGFSFEMHRGHGPVTTAMLGMLGNRVPWGEGHHAGYRKLADRMMAVAAVCEDLPEETNRVTLDESLTDSNGIPAAKIEYRISENSKKILAFAAERGRELFEAAGAAEITRVENPLPYAGWHNLGTARMGNDRQASVVNEWGRTHDVKNLFIIDGSLFVTSGGVNPTSTIQATALYIADAIKQRLGDASLFD
ncbi:MAG: GMC family oxidoreductase [Gammaproteobacteria bacterium]|nr:GMC family oxidoreductase [Gammaproteobacteria bacterium]MDD9957425.1 GMC family oxidoreductase [Gammaproteobacteria bacterium]